MAHPYQEHRAHKVEHERACRLTGGKLKYAHGGGVPSGEEDASDEDDREVAHDRSHRRATAKAHLKRGGHAEGKKAKHRMDRKRARGGRAEHGDEREDAALVKHMVKPGALQRARGGRAGKKGHTTVNISVGHPAAQGGPMPPIAAPMPPPSAGPPMGAVPPMGGSPGAPMLPRPPMAPPGGMPPVPMRAKGGRVGPGWRSSERNKTKVQHTDGKTDGKDIGRSKPITYARGGAIADGAQKPTKELPPPRIGSGIADGPQKPVVDGKSKLTAGSKSGVGRLQKVRMMERVHP